MRKAKPFILMVATIVAACLCSSVFATAIKDEIPIPLQSGPSNPPVDDGRPRSALDNIQVYYDTILASLCASLTNAGTSVSVEITNVATNETFDYVIPGSGLSILPISGNAGYWTITFTLQDGRVYGGYFII